MKMTGKCVLGFFGCVLLGLLGFSVPLEFGFWICFGWLFYLRRVLTEVTINFADVTVAITALSLFAIGVHRLCRWLSQSNPMESKWSAGRSAAIVAITLLMFIAGTAMIGMVHQTGWLVTMNEPIFGGYRGYARPGSINNARQLGLAALHHESAQSAFPSGCTMDKQGRLLHGWITQLLPYIEEGALYETIALNEPWSSDANRKPMATEIWPFMNPRVDRYDDTDRYADAHYASNPKLIGGNRRRPFDILEDGSSRTIILGEAAGAFHAWGSPRNWRDPRLGINKSPYGFGCPDQDVVIFTFADNHTLGLTSEMDPRLFQQLCTPNGGEQVDMDAL